jgi:hypothetical protein
VGRRIQRGWSPTRKRLGTCNLYAGYATGRINSKLNGRTNKFGWLQAPAIMNTTGFRAVTRQAVMSFLPRLSRQKEAAVIVGTHDGPNLAPVLNWRRTLAKSWLLHV